MATQQQAAGQVTAEQVLTKAALRAADHLGLNNVVLAQIIGLSEAAVSRMRNGRYLLNRNSKEFELAQMFVRTFRSLDAITGGDDVSARSWLVADNQALRARPIDLMKTVRGLVATADYVDSRRAIL